MGSYKTSVDSEPKKQSLLFKYLDIEGAELMLTNSNLQFTNATKLNDPFDCHPGLIDFPYEKMDNMSLGGIVRLYEAGRLYYPDQFRDYTYVCCLSKVFDSILMWSYYTKEHKGICIGLDIRNVGKYLPYIGFDVRYPESLTKYDYSSGTTKEAFRHQLATKAPEWGHEKEVRLLGPPIQQDMSYYRYKIGGDCFMCIYLGVNIGAKERQKIIELARKLNPNIIIHQMTVNPDAFKLDYFEVPSDLIRKK